MNYDPTQQSGPNPGSYYDPSQQPGPGQGPYQEYSSYNPYGEPQIPYEASYASYGNAYQVPPTAPLPLGQAVEQLPNQWWKALSKPGAQAFADEAGKASWDIIWLQLIGIAILTAILAVAQRAISPATTNSLTQLNPNATSNAAATAALANSPVFIVSVSLITALAGFFIGQGILFGLAKAFGGQGTFTQQAYVMLLFQVPLDILGGLLGIIPVGGFLLALAAGVYSLVLEVFAIMGVHRLSGGKASAVVLIPLGVVFLLVCCALALFAVALANRAAIR